MPGKSWLEVADRRITQVWKKKWYAECQLLFQTGWESWRKMFDGSFICDPVYMINSRLLHNRLLCWACGNEAMLKNMMSLKSSKNQDGHMTFASIINQKHQGIYNPIEDDCTADLFWKKLVELHDAEDVIMTSWPLPLLPPFQIDHKHEVNETCNIASIKRLKTTYDEKEEGSH